MANDRGATSSHTENHLRRERETLEVTLKSIGDAVIVTDVAGRVTFLNAVAERLTGWSLADAVDQPSEKVFHIVNEHTGKPVEHPVAKVLETGGIVGLANHTILITRDGRRVPIDDSGAPVRRSPPQRIQEFAARLAAAGIVTTTRRTRGDEIDAACGQLAGEVDDRTGVAGRDARRGARSVPLRVTHG